MTNHRFFFAAVIVFLLTAALLFAQPTFEGSSAHVAASSKLSLDRITPGSIVKGAIVVKIDQQWHINSNTPADEFLIKTEFTLQLPPPMILTDIKYPEGKLMKLGFSDKPMSVYAGNIVIFFALKVSGTASPGAIALKGSLQVQACNDKSCVAPSDIPISFDIVITSSDSTGNEINADVFGGYKPEGTAGKPATKNELADLFKQQGSVVAFLAIFLVGLALNLTPCVYPMLSVTVSLFGGQTENNPVRVFIKALVYMLGIVTMYSVLGVAAALTGGLFGSWLQSPFVLGAIALLLFGLALSMFGVYQIQMPYWLTSKLGGTGNTGLIGLYLSGMVVGVFAAPCVGPPVIALLALVGARGDPVFGFEAFFTLALGLGLPYLVLGTFSGLLKKIPRSGVWMIWVERLFGVVLVIVALFYGSMAFAPKLSAYIIPLGLIAGGIYLGFFERSGRDKKGLTRFKWVVGIVAVVLGLVTGRALMKPAMEWQHFSTDKIAAAKSAGIPVIIDFYADWCIPCMEIDRVTFTDPRVIEESKNFVRLKVDLTQFDSKENEAIRKQFAIAGVPTLVFLTGKGEEVVDVRLIGFEDADKFLKRLQQVERTDVQ